jgi:hypothetical protein
MATATFNSQLAVSILGRIYSTVGNSNLIRISVNHGTTSTDTGTSLANLAWGPYQSSTLAASADTTVDLTSFSDIFNTSGKTMARIRQIIIVHSSASLASSIAVFGAASNGIDPYGLATARTLKPGDTIVYDFAATTGLVVDATHKNFRYKNNDAVNAATWSVIIVGSTT